MPQHAFMNAQPMAADAQNPVLAESPLQLALQLQAEREQQSRLERRVQRLRRLLTSTEAALQQSRAELSLAWQSACRDPLTGLVNRRGFEPPMRHELARHAEDGQVLALLFVDLDGFKAVNDSLGHEAGDELLRIVGARLVAGMRRSDLVCRYGGDEFVCLLPQLQNPRRAGRLAAGLLRSITQPCLVGGRLLRVRVSIGVAVYPRDGETLPALLRSADSAMYSAKAQGAGIAMARRTAPV